VRQTPERKAPARARSHVAPATGLPVRLAALRDAARQGSCFQVLGLEPDATTTEVREAWVALSATLHDLREGSAGDAEALAVLDETTQVAEDAFAILSDPDLRLQYRRALQPAPGREPWRS
jgi:hypothetical protein